ncbi:MAG: hypothetical protein ACRDPA_16875 [Solirubrobacteraceae bacterium]
MPCGIVADIARDISDSASRLLLKAIRSLPEHEQDRVLAYLLERALVPDPDRPVGAAQASAEAVMPPHVPMELSSTRMETWSSAPWQHWSASLILRRLADGVTVDQLASELALEPEILRAAVRDLGKRSNVSRRLAEILSQLADGKTLGEATGELQLTEQEAAGELEPTDALSRGLCATLLIARASAPASMVGQLGVPDRGPLRTMPVRFPQQQYQRLKDWCETHNFPMAVVVRGVVERFLDEQQRRAG